MPPRPQFPHLALVFQGQHRARLHGRGEPDPRVEANRANRAGHAQTLRTRISSIRADWQQEQDRREHAGLPVIGNRTVFLLELPDEHNLTYLTKTFGLELIAEYEDGLVLAGTPNLDVVEMERALQQFEISARGGASCAKVLDIFGPNDPRRLQKVLSASLLARWPFADAETLTLDIWVEVPANPGYQNRPRARRRGGETEAQFIARREAAIATARNQQQMAWDDARDARIAQLESFITGNAGQVVGQIENAPQEDNGLVYFPDSVLVRVTMSGRGFRDVVLNFPFLVSLSEPDEADHPPAGDFHGEPGDDFILTAPADDAPAVCIIDSGIQEDHRWLIGSIDRAASQCYVPGKAADDVADECRPVGHGTLVAGAVLYPQHVPRNGKSEPIAWLQNARVLDGAGQFSPQQNNLLDLQTIVEVSRSGPRQTRLYVHSINDTRPCHQKRMTAWAALLDTLSHKHDVLFFQSAGNLVLGVGNHPNPGVQGHLAENRDYPDFLLEPSSRVASPAQSLHAMTVGSVSSDTWHDGGRRSFAPAPHHLSAFSRTGLGLWDSIKPEVVECGGDFARDDTGRVIPCPATAPELVQSTLYGGAAIGRAAVGTSFSNPKVAHIAAHLQAIFPASPALLYRALIINSARWPQWAEAAPAASRLSILRQFGFGVPDLSRATENTARRVTLITDSLQEISNQQALVYSVPVPASIRDTDQATRIRIDVTLCYSATPRPTRATKNGYLETWLSWKASHLEEPFDSFLNRATVTGENAGQYPGLPWMLNQRDDIGGIEGANRHNGTAQKDWVVVENAVLQETFAIAVQAHKGWNQDDHGGNAKFVLVVSFEALDRELDVYAQVRAAVESELQARNEVLVPAR